MYIFCLHLYVCLQVRTYVFVYVCVYIHVLTYIVCVCVTYTQYIDILTIILYTYVLIIY